MRTPCRYRIIEIEDGRSSAPRYRRRSASGVAVTRRRRLHTWRGVRIHLDEVEGLGTFIELEAVARPDSDLTREHALIDDLRAAFAISDDRLVSGGYAAQLQD